jgi:hypothetical protein
LVSLLIFSGCKESVLLQQVASDYFPVDRRCLWYYSTDSDTIEVSGGEVRLIASRDAYVLYTGVWEGFFYKCDQEIDRLFFTTIDTGDKEDTLFIWTYYLPGHLLDGDEWDETYTVNDAVMGDEISFSVHIWGRIVERSGDCCEIERTTRVIFSSNQFGNEDSTVESYEWYKKEIGLSKAIINGKEYNLINYSFLD